MKLRGTTRILGIFGDPVAHSLSPLMQNAALQQTGIDAVYVPFHVKAAELAEAVGAIRFLDIWGVNVTVPHKETVCAFLDEIDASARLIGAVNTIVNRDGCLVGYNTDASGFLRSLGEDLQFTVRGKRVLLLGAGGACRAALVALCQAGASRIAVANRTLGRAEGLVGEFAGTFGDTRLESFGLDPEQLQVAARNVDLVVNTSTVGLKGESFTGLPLDDLNPGAVVYDMVYAPGATPLIREAARKGLRAADGLGMLAGQGEEAFLVWTGRKPPAGLMKRILQKEVTSF
jgi:shikimate dehydrogenase